jgi:putative ABC transport system permease protein
MRSARIFGKHWKLTLIAVFSLSAGIALGVIAISISNTFLFLPLAASEPDRLVTIYSHSLTEDIAHVSYPDYEYFRARNDIFTDIAAAPGSISITIDPKFGPGNVKVISRPVSPNYFSVLGLKPHLGRLFTDDDDHGDTRAGLLTYNCWTRLGSDPNVIGKKLSGNTIVGVLPKSYTGSLFGIDGDLITLMSEANAQPDWKTNRAVRPLILTARLKPGVSLRQAQTEMSALAGQLATAYPKDDKDRTVAVLRATLLPPDGIPTARLMLSVLMLVALLVLLIACANVANLLLAVAVGRRQEAAIKLALAAQRSRLIFDFLKESSILCLASSAIGYSLAAFLIHRYPNISIAVPTVGPVTFGANLHLDATVWAFTAALTLIAVFVTGLPPAFYASAASLASILGGEMAVGGTGRSTRRNILVIVQVAVCTLVLVGMGLAERSLYNLRHLDPGFSERNLVAMSIFSSDLSNVGVKRVFDQLREKIAAIPGVESVTFATSLPLFGGELEAMSIPGREKPERVRHSIVDGAFFETLGVRLLSGRAFNSADRADTAEVVIINHKLAEMFYPGQNPLGKEILIGEKLRKAAVIGVAANGKYEEINEEQAPFAYYAMTQHEVGFVSVAARTKGDPKLWIAPLAGAMRALHLTVLDPVTYDHWLDLTLFIERLIAKCAEMLSSLGLLLAAIGLFGAVSYSVSERRKELGIRVALGARPVQLLSMILRHTILIAGAGVAIGMALGVTVTMLLRSQFYGISAVEVAVLIPVGAAMLTISVFVAYVSARPWLSIDPMEAVRHG